MFAIRIGGLCHLESSGYLRFVNYLTCSVPSWPHPSPFSQFSLMFLTRDWHLAELLHSSPSNLTLPQKEMALLTPSVHDHGGFSHWDHFWPQHPIRTMLLEVVMYSRVTRLSCTHVSHTSFAHVPSGTGVDEVVNEWAGDMRLAPFCPPSSLPILFLVVQQTCATTSTMTKHGCHLSQSDAGDLGAYGDEHGTWDSLFEPSYGHFLRLLYI